MSITEYKVIKSPLDSIASIMATYIADGYQPVGQPVMQFPAEKTALQVVAKGADTAITDYDIIKAPTDSFAAAMATAIADGFQPFGQPIMLFPDDKTILQAVIKGDASGGGGSVTVVVADISDATDTGKALLLADDEEAARAAIGAVSAEDIPEAPAAPTWDTLAEKPLFIAAGATQAAARTAIGAGTGNSNLAIATTPPAALAAAAAVGTGATAARADHVHALPTAAQVGASPTGHNHAVTADAASGLEAAANIQALAVALSTRIKVLEDAAP